MQRKASWVHLFLVCLVVSPAIFLSFQIFKYSVNVPYWDQWSSPGNALENIYRGQFSFVDLFSQHNEHRILFPNLIFIALAYLTDWNTRYEVLLTFLLACITSLNIYRLTRLSIGRNQLVVAGLAFVSNLLIFSPVQYENWLWGFQSILLFPMFYITSCLLVIRSRWSTSAKLITCMGLSVASSFSLSNGLFCWLAFLLAFLFSRDWTHLKWKRKFIFCWFCGFLATLFLYFYRYQKPTHHPGLKEVISKPQQAIVYFFSFLGSPLATFKPDLASWFGVVLFCLFVGLCFYVAYRSYIAYKSRQEFSLIYRTGSWLIIGLFVVASTLATTISRSGFGVEQALSARYTSFSIYLIVSVIQLSTTVAIDFVQNNQSQQWISDGNISSQYISPKDSKLRLIFAVILTAFITSISIFNLLSATNGIQSMRTLWQDRLYAKTCLIFVTFVDNACITESLFPDANFLEARAQTAELMGLIEPDLAQTAELSGNITLHGSNPEKYGFFDAFNQADFEHYVAAGWAVLPNKHKPADAVLLTYRQNKKPIIFAVAPVKSPRPDVVNALKDEVYLNAGWGTTFSTKNLPAGDLQINAWAFDLDSGSAYRLKKFHKLQR